MTIKHSTRAVRVLRIYCPIDRKTSVLLMSGELSSIDRTSALGAILEIVRGDNPLGDFGLYKSVVELSSGWEMFTPGADAQPALGAAGRTEASPTAILTVYIPADAADDAVSSAIDAIMAAHPWEVPVIELGETLLLTRG